MQAAADAKIEELMESKTPEGRVLRDIATINERNYKNWQERQKKLYSEAVDNVRAQYEREKDFYGYKSLQDALDRNRVWKSEYPTEMRVYRGGSRKAVEAWTSREGGADIGSGMTISVDHTSSVSDMLKTHYMIGSNFANTVGAPGESEILFVKKKRK